MKILSKLLDQFNSTSSLRTWWDPYMLIVEMCMLFGLAIFLLVTDIAQKIADPEMAMSREDYLYAFKERMRMVYTTVPYYLEELRRIDNYNRLM